MSSDQSGSKVVVEGEPPFSNIRYTDTLSAYDAWSEVYDTDGNFLQALDTLEMKTLLPKMLTLLNIDRPWRVVDLGCGTGRNTMALLNLENVEVVALDLSPKMLEVAQQRLDEHAKLLSSAPKLTLKVFDMLNPDMPVEAQNADAVVSTLVIEHVPLDTFFNTAAKMVKPGGYLLVTNMHSEMGTISQAGFVDPKTGEKIRPQSYAHTVENTILVARQIGFHVVDSLEERKVSRDSASKLGPRALKWIDVFVWYGGIFRKEY